VSLPPGDTNALLKVRPSLTREINATNDAARMREDLEVFDFQLDPDDVERIEGLDRP
jgi:hypothetical protein